MGSKTAMRPFAFLPRTLVSIPAAFQANASGSAATFFAWWSLYVHWNTRIRGLKDIRGIDSTLIKPRVVYNTTALGSHGTA